MANWFAKQPKEHLAGKCAVVVGGNSGIGKAAAEAIAAAGANMVIAGVPEQGCIDEAEALKKEGTNAVGVACDVTSQESIDNVIKVAEENFGQIDILVSSAGISLPRMNSVEVKPEQWDKLFSINLKGNFFLMASVARAMEAKGVHGKMVVVASARGINSMENIAPYCIAKAGVMGMVRSLAVDLAKKNIIVNGIAPGYVLTPMVEKVFEEQPQQKAYVQSRTPLPNYMGSLDEMAAAILHLVLPVTEYTTGQTLILDGGWSIQ
ncbi:MAG: SDR family NAD(P)-dependent oxidoreductase [Eggerthellaceae bacterium]